MIHKRLAVVGVCATALCGTASAQSVPNATADNSARSCITVGISCAFQDNTSNHNLSTTIMANVGSKFPDAGTNVIASVTANSTIPSIKVTGSAAPVDGAQTYVEAIGDLNYHVVASGTTTPVMIDIDYLLTVSTSGQTDAGVQFYESFGLYNYSDTLSFNNSSGSYSQSRLGHITTTLEGGTVDNIFLGASGESYGILGIDAPSTFSAYIDPHIYIDPAYLLANPGARLEISAGVGNIGPGVATVPEPSTWALMVLGIGGVGVTLRRSGRRPLKVDPIIARSANAEYAAS